MELVIALIFLLAFAFSLPKSEDSPKTEEEVLGEAIANYLKKGIKIDHIQE